MQRLDNVPAFIDAQRGLGHIREILRLLDMEALHVFDRGHQVELIRDLAQRPDHLRVSRMADKDQFIPLRIVAVHFVMHLDHQRTGGIDHVQAAALRLLPHRFCHTVGTEDHDRSFRHFIQLFHKHGTLMPQRVHDMPAVDDLMAHINRGAVFFERQIDDIYGAVDTRAESTRIG